MIIRKIEVTHRPKVACIKCDRRQHSDHCQVIYIENCHLHDIPRRTREKLACTEVRAPGGWNRNAFQEFICPDCQKNKTTD